MRTRLLSLLGIVVVVGCEDKVGESRNDVAAAIATHAAEADAHHAKTVSASELTEGTLDAARLPATVNDAVADVADHEQRIGTAESTLVTHGTTLTTHGDAIGLLETDVATHATQLSDHETRLADAETDIADRVVKSGDVMTGSLTATNFSFATPKTKRVAVQAYAFVGEDSTTTWDGAASTGNGARWITGGTLIAVAPISFPDGAVLTQLSARVFDNNDAGRIEILLRRFSGTGSVATLATAASTDVEASATSTISAALSATVDNSSDAAYFLVWRSTVAGDSTLGPVLYSASVEYTYASP